MSDRLCDVRHGLIYYLGAEDVSGEVLDRLQLIFDRMNEDPDAWNIPHPIVPKSFGQWRGKILTEADDGEYLDCCWVKENWIKRNRNALQGGLSGGHNGSDILTAMFLVYDYRRQWDN